MATKATIYKALLNIANMDTNYYNEHNLTLHSILQKQKNS